MAGFLDKFRNEIITSIWKEEAEKPKVKNIDDKIALGVLLWVVAEADDKFLPQEEKRIKELLLSYARVSSEDMPVVMGSIRQAAKERIDLYKFTHEVSENLPNNVKISIIEDLFRVACIDKELDSDELEVIRKITGLFRLSHKDFIDAKIKIKKEFSIQDTL